MRVFLSLTIALIFIFEPHCHSQAPLAKRGQPQQFVQPTQQVYSLSLKKDLPLATAAMGLTVTNFILKRNKSNAIDPDYIMGLNPESVNGFDASAVGNNSYAAGKASDIFMYTSMASPLLLMADNRMRKDWKELSLITAETYLLTLGIVSLTKNLVDRPRPRAFNPEIPLDERTKSDNLNSFMSGHTAATAMSTFMMASILTDYYPDTKWKPLIWTLASGIPLTTGMLRYKAGKHYFTDVLAGYAVGAVTGYFVPKIHKKIKMKIDQRQPQIIEFFDDADAID